MTDLLDPFLVPYQENPDYSHADAKAEALRVADANDLAIAVLQGDADMDDYLEMLFERGADPIAWMQQAATSMERVLDGSRVYVTNENGIYIPF